VWFSMLGEDAGSEEKLVLENGNLYFQSNEHSKRSFMPSLLSGKSKKTGFKIPVRGIRNVLREKGGILTIKHNGNAKLPTECGAISIDYFAEDRIGNKLGSTTFITQGNTIIASLKRQTLELRNAYKVDDKFSDREDLILSGIYASALDFSSSARALTAEAFGLSEDELKNHWEHLSTLDLVDRANQILSENGVKYVIALSKNSTFGG
jgi:uncharacterized protein YmfQ (DUF2313 family)